MKYRGMKFIILRSSMLSQYGGQPHCNGVAQMTLKLKHK